MPDNAEWDILYERMQKLGISADDLDEKFVLGSGSGGQKINKTNSCVFLKHNPTGITVKCQLTRSRASNRYHALQELCDKIESAANRERLKLQFEREKKRRQNRKRTAGQKEKMLQQKRLRKQVKQSRRPPSRNGD